MQFVVMGLVYYSFGVYLKPLAAALDTDRFTISLTLSIESIVIALVAPYVSRLFDKQELRHMLYCGVGLFSAGFILLSQVREVWHLYLVYGGVIALGTVCLTALPCNMMLTNWFLLRRGTAMGISVLGVSLSAAVMVPLLTWLFAEYGWRISFLVCGVGLLCVLLPLIWKFAIRTPEEVGLFPDGGVAAHAMKPSVSDVWTFQRGIRSRDLWLITMIVGFCNMAIASVILSLPAHATDLGISALKASSIVALTAVLGAAGKASFGFMADIFPKKAVLTASVVLQVIGLAVIIAVHSYEGLLVAALLFGFGYGGVAPLWPIMLAARFGRESFPTIMGPSLSMVAPFGIVAVPLTNWLFEAQGSYLPAFQLMFFAYLAAIVSLLLLRMEPDSNDS